MRHFGLYSVRTADTPRVTFPPGPTEGALGTLRFLRDGLRYLFRGETVVDEMVQKYGGAFQFNAPMFGKNVVVTEPALIKQVFTERPDILLGGKGVSPTVPIYGTDSMFVHEEPEHMRRRKMLTPAFIGKALAGYEKTMLERTAAAFDTWPENEKFSLSHETHRLTLDIIIRVIFGVTEDAEVAAMVGPLQRLLRFGVSEEIVIRYAYRSFGTLKYWRRLRRTFAEVDPMLQDLVARRRATPPDHRGDDVLSILLATVGADGELLTDREIHDDLITLLLAGHETTGNTLAWCVHELTRAPAAMARVREEAETGGSKFTDAVIQEVLRLRPPAVATARVTADHYRLGEWQLPPNTWIVLHIGGVNHRPDIYEDPWEFRAERFVDSPPGSFTWIPFGGGIKRCLGAAFAMLEVRTSLHYLVRHGDFYAADRPDELDRRGVILRPKRGIQVVLHKRQPVR
ncbi:cytochrome P450 [Nocardia sp. CDC159]|uniref:Cytochrome P450 n=1 Tax=Nocardia pulmonis TaxID=2951408 RepID=A0A9X2E998_9NOCA|nr:MULTISPECIES: cytochrome P450 [Nocardia]MCM6776654.1 cytochrome P450 [Nocardia pulmonis]MCM6789197.1 cytochrome P450 [Nocardia sp. CDC159]